VVTLAQVNLGESVENGLAAALAFLPKLLAFILILVIGWIIARVLARIVDRLLERVGFDRAVERGGVKRALARSKFDASDLLAKLVFYGVMLFVLQLAFGVFGPNPISALLFGIIAFLPRIFVAILIVVIAAAIAAAVRELVDTALGGLSYGRLLANGAGAVILGVGVFAALNQLQIAPAIVNGLFYAILAIIVGVTVIAVGGGGVAPMRARWEQALQRLDDEGSKVRQEVASTSREDIEERAQQRAAQARQQDGDRTIRSTTPNVTATNPAVVDETRPIAPPRGPEFDDPSGRPPPATPDPRR
jgi:MFS family permease